MMPMQAFSLNETESKNGRLFDNERKGMLFPKTPDLV